MERKKGFNLLSTPLFFIYAANSLDELAEIKEQQAKDQIGLVAISPEKAIIIQCLYDKKPDHEDVILGFNKMGKFLDNLVEQYSLSEVQVGLRSPYSIAVPSTFKKYTYAEIESKPAP